MLIILISCFSFILFSNSLSVLLVRFFNKDSHMFNSWILSKMLRFLVSWPVKTRAMLSYILMPLSWMSPTDSGKDNVEENQMSLLDLPELPLHCILDRLSPDGLCNMASVCTSLRNECRSEYYWEKHLSGKWGRILGEAAYTEWQSYVATHNRSISLSQQARHKDWLSSILSVFFGSLKKPESSRDPQLIDSAMTLYLALESGKFWFPAQVYNRENGHAGFLLSCYDAKVRYDATTDTFHARYSPHGRQTLEENIEWGRLREPVPDTPAKSLHDSDCLADLQPGDHVEVQWRRNKEFPYGWWYAVVGHMETCTGSHFYCRCRQSDTLVLEFKQYATGSRWRQTLVKRNTHREEGNSVDGFYGGIRKLCNTEEISTWKQLWPAKILE